MRTSHAAFVAALALATAFAPAPGAAQPYVPPPPDQVPGYFAAPMPCRIETDEGPTRVVCEGGVLDGKSLRELSVLRNTIFARQGWDGYRKPWLRAHFHAQPWFKPNPKFTYKLLSDADRKNAHFIGAKEHSFTESELRLLRSDVYARRGKVWNDRFESKEGKGRRTCDESKSSEDHDRFSNDCYYAKQKWYKADPAFTDARLTPDDWVELGLIDRALGGFAVDEERRDRAADASLDRLLAPAELRKLSLRDLRVLRNTLYARRGRPFKSPLLRKHFEGMSWYKVRTDYSDKLLSRTDRRNIGLIKSVENEFGGPLADEDFLIEPFADGA